jgi:FKBP12-rapamycin complex-associated protein
LAKWSWGSWRTSGRRSEFYHHILNYFSLRPQLLARIDHQDLPTRALLHELLVRLVTRHADASVYPLFVAIKSQQGRCKEAAVKLKQSLREHSAHFVAPALPVSQKLVRMAILWEES